MASLKVESVDFQMRVNRKLHHTEKFEQTHHHAHHSIVPVLRRGQSFHLSITFKDRPYNPDIDDVSLVFKFGGDLHPTWERKSRVKLSAKDKFTDDKTQVDAIIKKLEGNTMHLEVISPIMSPVGEWKLEVWTKLANTQDYDKEKDVYYYKGKIYLLFNPWCKDDTVYMEDKDEKLLEEYIMSTKGKIYKGDQWNTNGMPWHFGQFKRVVLEAVVLILQDSGLKGVDLGDPVKVTRALSNMVNNEGNKNGKQGVLEGKWDGNYEDGVKPSSWTGSVKILAEYVKTRRTVKYGQCWVFSGVLTTLCRALGIPARSVTNYESAHDTDGSLTCDRYYFPNSNKHVATILGKEKDDSIWNFHVWTDVWMVRPDIPEGGCDGWQAIDATPQEASNDGYYQCGPAPLAAIRRGDIAKPYDVKFLLAEVNAEVCKWRINPKGPFKHSFIKSESDRIGKKILTKNPAEKYDPKGDYDMLEITNEYKAEKGTEEEKACFEVLENARRALASETPEEIQDLEFEMDEMKGVNIGDDIKFGINIKKKCQGFPNITAVLIADSIFYHGKKGKRIAFDQITKSVYGLTDRVELYLPQSKYMDKLVEYGGIQFYATITLEGTNKIWADEQSFHLGKPKIQVQVPKELRKGEETKVTFKFWNYLKQGLTNCRFHFEGTGLCSPQNVEFRDIAPKEQASLEVTITPEYEGEHMLSVAFESDELIDVHGSALVNVVE